jgi:antitoxin component YwqK of YwqJK toxin-antitoxin module
MLEGPITTSIPNDRDQVWARCIDSNGLKHGIEARWTLEGRIIATRRYARGTPNGIWIAYHENGRLWMIESFEQGQLHGLFANIHEGGHAIIGVYRRGEKEALWCNESAPGIGPASAGEYRRGERHGEWLFVDHKQSKVLRKGSYRAGKKQGLWVEDGEEACYDNDVLHGPYRSWDSAGRAIAFGSYREGQRDGWWSWYQLIPDEGGPSRWRERYVDGQIVERRDLPGDATPRRRQPLRCFLHK